MLGEIMKVVLETMGCIAVGTVFGVILAICLTGF